MTTSLAIAPVDLRSRLFGNFAASLGETVLRFLLGLVLARLLLPAELGVFSVAVAVFGVALLLRDFGVSAYLQRVPELTARRFSACLGLQILSTIVTTLGLLLLADPLARWLGQPDLGLLLHVLAWGLPIAGFCSIVAALHLRELALARIARVSLLGVACQVLAAIMLIKAGVGVIGLAWAQMFAIAVCTAVYACWVPAGLPWRLGWRGMREPLEFGGAALTAGGLSVLLGVQPELMLGGLGGAHDVGLLGRAQATVAVFMSLVGPVLSMGSLPLLASRQARGLALEPALRRVTALLTGLGWPALAMVALWREPLVRALYGPGWTGCAAAIPPLALSAAAGLVFAQQGQALAAVGRPGLVAWSTGASLLARLALVAAGFDGSLASFAWALCAASFLVLPLQVVLSMRHLGQSPRDLAAAVAGSGLATLAAVVVPWPLAPVAWLAALCWTRHPLLDEWAQLSRRRMTSRK
ncbi:oligosaccharide flippase family protein [Roseateles saccharophilus]|uniref:O-antigen/teichoic acid export membrane protein n=1 Tax=Roseateles saccharophilus TaxID=304 RepID=A0A4R3UN45_ROSSA|nr:oligosaccharide flippase family protein [Roseateles saccharophilus]MDG0833460.1 hypothetical protein [Roseateles saccharophilus]TCU93115.1 O-antigen/teichoic acid export membrane protein [Roseateles saccharophilus]